MALKVDQLIILEDTRRISALRDKLHSLAGKSDRERALELLAEVRSLEQKLATLLRQNAVQQMKEFTDLN